MRKLSALPLNHPKPDCWRSSCVVVLEYLQQDSSFLCFLIAGLISCIFSRHSAFCLGYSSRFCWRPLTCQNIKSDRTESFLRFLLQVTSPLCISSHVTSHAVSFLYLHSISNLKLRLHLEPFSQQVFLHPRLIFSANCWWHQFSLQWDASYPDQLLPLIFEVHTSPVSFLWYPDVNHLSMLH